MQVPFAIRVVDELFEVVDTVRKDRINNDDEATLEFVLVSLYQLLPIVARRVLGVIKRRLRRKV